MSFFIILLFLLASVMMTRTKMKSDSHGHECSLYGFMTVKANFGNESRVLCLKLKSIGTSSLANSDAALFLDLDSAEFSEDQNFIQAYPLNDFAMAYGYPLDDPASGSAEGYIGDDDHFYGVLYLDNRTLFADPYGKDYPHQFFGAFENDHMTAPRRRRDHAQESQMDFDRQYLPFQLENSGRMFGTARARICDLLLLADKEFYEKDANSSLKNVVQRMMHAVAQADVVFRNADFNEDGVPDNIGFSVKYILVLTSQETNTRVFGSLLDARAIDGREYLMKFARLRRLSEVCLGIAFSGHAFHNRTLGLSFTSLGGGIGGAAGGLCDRRAYGRSFNTLAIAHATSEDHDRVPERVAALTLVHEMGHSFGAHHDENFPNPECRGKLMSSQSSTADDRKHLEFSVCSKRLIAQTLNSMSYCFSQEDKAYCGNGIVEEGEECDCGLPSRCHRDPCCTPRAGGALFFDEGSVHKEGCSVAPSAQCHPSQGLCCLSNCQFADLTRSGIDCKDQSQACSCTNSTMCQCGLGGLCLGDSCHAAECALLGLEECHCVRSPGGEIGKNRMCGICCKLEGADESSKCLGAEQAANEIMSRRSLPVQWPSGRNYTGPHVTIELCSQKSGNTNCKAVSLRAWPQGSVCVSKGAVGICNERGVCTRSQKTPRSNVFPNIVLHKTLSRKFGDVSSSSTRRSFSTLLLLCIFFVKIL